jgi:nucleoside-diphosphate-sugar epimerase
MDSLDGRLVVLGATGFVGGHVVDRARELGWEVLGLSSKDMDLASPNGAEMLSAILRDGDTVVHGAAIVPTRNAGEVSQNLVVTQSVVDAIAGHEIAQLVVVSSDAVYGSESGIISEASACSPDSMHGIMSLAREMMCREVKTPVFTIVRPAPIYGVGDPHKSYGPNRFIGQMVDSGEITLFGEGAAMRDHVFIDDVADVIVRTITARESGVINIASGQSISFAALAELICEAGTDGSRTTVVGSESSPTFRSYDISNLVRLFPDFEPVPPAVGIRRVVAAVQGSISSSVATSSYL